MLEQEALQCLIETHVQESSPALVQMNRLLGRAIPALRFESKEHRFVRAFAEGLLRREQVEVRSLHPEPRPAPQMATFDLAGREFYEVLPNSEQESRCEWCRGTGRCPFCDGRGANPHVYAKNFGRTAIAPTPCNACTQTGLCEHCKGNKTNTYKKGLRIKYSTRTLGPYTTAPSLFRDKLQWQPAPEHTADPYRESGQRDFQGVLERMFDQLKSEADVVLTRPILEEGVAWRVRYQWRGARELWLFGPIQAENALFTTPPFPNLF